MAPTAAVSRPPGAGSAAVAHSREGVFALWPTPLLVARYAEAGELNAVLARAFVSMRLADCDGAPPAFYASRDDLIYRVDLPEFRELFGFISENLRRLAQTANAQCWPQAPRDLKLEIAGAWFQIQNRGAFHDVHSHGNCSWSGVYYLQIDPPEQRARHPVLGPMNGLTRFYGPYLDRLGGAHMDMGNAYLQQSHFDVVPEEGMLVLFPSYLNHKAMPYDGERDRIIVSFNAAVHGAQGDRVFGYAPG